MRDLDAVNAIERTVLKPLRIAFAAHGCCNKLLSDLASPTDISLADNTELAERSRNRSSRTRCSRALVEASNCRKGMVGPADQEAGAQYLSAITGGAGTMRLRTSNVESRRTNTMGSRHH